MSASKLYHAQTGLPDSLPKFSLDVATSYLGETEERKSRALQELWDIIRDDKSMSDIDFEQDFLVQFLRHAKYDVRRASCRLKNFVGMRRKHDYMFQAVPDECFYCRESFKTVHMLPYRCPEGCAILCANYSQWKYGEMSLNEYMNITMMMTVQSLRDPMTQIHGYKIIFNFQDAPLRHLTHCTPSNIHLLYQLALNCIPARYKVIYIVPNSPIFKIARQFVKAMLSEKLKSRIKLLGSPEELRQYFPAEILPPLYGGCLKYDPADWQKRTNKDHAHFGLSGQPNYY